MLQWFPSVKMTFTVTQTCSNCNSSVCDSVSVQLWEVLIRPAIKESYHCPHHSISLWLLWRVHLEFATRKYWITHNWHAIWMILSKTSLFPGSTSLLDWSNFSSAHKPRALLNASRVLIIQCLPCCVYVGVFSSTTNNRLCSKIPDIAWPTSARTSGS